MPDTPSALNLSTLPPDIMRLIASMEEDSLDEIRMISPSWNASVQAHLADNRYKHALERVFIRVEDDSSDEEDNDDDDDGHKRAAKVDSIVMHAILPTTCSNARIGVGKWLTVHEQFPDAIEVTCTPQLIESSSSILEEFYEKFGSESSDDSDRGSGVSSESVPVPVPPTPRPKLTRKRRGGSIDCDHVEEKKAKKDASQSSSTYSLRSNKDALKRQLYASSAQTLLAHPPVTFKQQPCSEEKQSISRRNVEEEWRKIEKANREIEEQRRMNEENARKNEMDRRKIEEDKKKIEEEWRRIEEGRRRIEKVLEEEDKQIDTVNSTLQRKQSTIVDQFARFFSNFSHIGTVVLKDFYDTDTAKTIMASLRDMQVNRLDSRFCYDDDGDMRAFLLDSVRKHRIRHLIINMYSEGVKTFVSFVTEIVKLNATIDFYDHSYDESSPRAKYFGRLPTSWEKMSAELAEQGISMTLSCKRDDDFDDKLSRFHIRSHISVMSVEQRKSGVNVGFEEVRGYDRHGVPSV